jgi:hypothetical protein
MYKMKLPARIQFYGISSFPFVLFSYVLLSSLCINIFAFCVNVTHSVFCTTYVLLFMYCSLFIVYVTLPPVIGPIAVGNKYMYIKI